MNSSGNTVLITGGATGIGLALAEAFAAAGNFVIICGRRKEKLEEAQKKIPGIITRACDVALAKEREKLITWVVSHYPEFNILVNNAGIQNLVLFKQPVDAGQIESEVVINLVAPVHFSGLVFRHFSAKQESAILNISSGLGFVPISVLPVYCATKAALHSFTISFRHQMKGTRIKVFEIIPPTVETELDHGSRKKRGVDPGIHPSIVATGTMKALSEDLMEASIGEAVNLVRAASNPVAAEVFRRMNG